MNSNKWKAIVFDLDDTLYPERDYVLSGFKAVAAWAEQRFGIPAVQGFAELRGYFEAGVRGHTFDQWLAAHQVDKSGVQEAVDIYRRHAPAIAPFPGVPEMLAHLRSHYALGLVSDGDLVTQQRKLSALGLRDMFDAVVFSDALGRDAWKPSTKPFEAVLKQLGSAPQQSMYVADNVLKDFAGARELAMFTVLVLHPGGEYAASEPPDDHYRPHATIGAVTELSQLLLSMESA
jgi:putative hydrolase of the HAD superfamily